MQAQATCLWASSSPRKLGAWMLLLGCATRLTAVILRFLNAAAYLVAIALPGRYPTSTFSVAEFLVAVPTVAAPELD